MLRYDATIPSLVKTAAAEVRLTELQHYILDWPSKRKVKHPRMEMTPVMVKSIGAKAQSDPYFIAVYEQLQQDRALRALVERDKKAAAAVARGVLGDLNSRFNFPLNEGIEFSSHLSPVGIRPVFRHAGQIDLLLGDDDLLEPAIKQQLRERFAYLAYLLTDSSFMAHKYNAGHPNFDADRYVAIAAIAMLYPDHPHAQQWLDHAVRSLRKAMRVYVVPGSGKWAENLGGYYNWSTNIIGGMANALKHTGAADPYAWPEFQDFWRWGLVTALPPKPWIGNLGGDRAADKLVRVRQTPGIGDNGGDGGLSVHGGFALAGAHILQHNPELGRQLLWLWDQGGRAGYGHYPYALFFGLNAGHLHTARDPRSAPRFPSRVLEGYGSIFRADFGRPSEGYLLFKCGPGGYRYHGEEGSFVLFGQGQPLSLDGANNFRPEQHSTVTFGKENTGLLRGRIVQFESTPQLDYTAGRFPGTPEQLRRTGTLARPESDEEPTTGKSAHSTRALHKEGDVICRQILFRKNDYVVIRDRIDSVQDATWRMLLLVEELKKSKHRLDGRGWLGVNVAVSLFQFASGSESLQPVPAQRITVDSQPLRQQRIALPLPPGYGVVAVINFFKPGQKPWRVKPNDGRLVLDSAKGNVTEIIKLSGDTLPRAQWQQLRGTRETATWTSSQFNDPWHIMTGIPSPSSAAASSSHELLTIAGCAATRQQAKADLLRYKTGIAALQSLGLFTMMTLGQHLGVVEPDGSGGLQSRELRDAKTPLPMTGRIEQAHRNKLPPQFALIRTGNSTRHHTVSLLARRSLSQWSGHGVHEITVQDVLAGKLKEFAAAGLFQASASDISKETRQHIQGFVTAGGTLICDMPSLAGEDGAGTTAAWSEFLGISYGTANPRGRFAIADANRGYTELRAADAEFLRRTGGDLGHLYAKPEKAACLIRDKSGRTTVVAHPVGGGRVITLNFRFTSVAPDTNNQIYLAKLLRPFLAESDMHPLVDAPWVEKTILPQDDNGLMIGLHNPQGETIHSTLRLPHHSSPHLTPIYVPFGGVIGTDRVVLPPRSWVVFGVK